MGTWSDYIRLYVTASKKIKQRFPNVKVGGPAMARLNINRWNRFVGMQTSKCTARLFLVALLSCARPNYRNGQPGKDILNKHGFVKTELHLNEWHCYFGGDFNGDPSQFKFFVETMGGPDAAAGLCTCLPGGKTRR